MERMNVSVTIKYLLRQKMTFLCCCIQLNCVEIGLLVPKKMSKKRKLADGSRKVVQPIPLDSSGRPVFPIVLGGLTVYSLGEVSVSVTVNL